MLDRIIFFKRIIACWNYRSQKQFFINTSTRCGHMTVLTEEVLSVKHNVTDI